MSSSLSSSSNASVEKKSHVALLLPSPLIHDEMLVSFSPSQFMVIVSSLTHTKEMSRRKKTIQSNIRDRQRDTKNDWRGRWGKYLWEHSLREEDSFPMMTIITVMIVSLFFSRVSQFSYLIWLLSPNSREIDWFLKESNSMEMIVVFTKIIWYRESWAGKRNFLRKWLLLLFVS